MWNGIALAPREHTPALTLGPSQLTLVGALTRKPLGQSSSNSLCNRAPVANLMHVKHQPFICIIFDTFPSRFCPKSAIFWGVGLLKRLNLRNCAVHFSAVSDLDSQDVDLSKTGHVFELQSAV